MNGRVSVVSVGGAAAVYPGVVVLNADELDLGPVSLARHSVSRRRRVLSTPRHPRSRAGTQHEPIRPSLLLLHTFNGPLSGTTRVSRYQKGKTNLDFTGARDSEWKWHQLDRIQACTSLQTDNHASTPPLSFLQAACPSCRPTNSVKVLKTLRCAQHYIILA